MMCAEQPGPWDRDDRYLGGRATERDGVTFGRDQVVESFDEGAVLPENDAPECVDGRSVADAVIRSRWPRAFTRSTLKPLSSLWKVTRSTRPARFSRSGAPSDPPARDVPPLLIRHGGRRQSNLVVSGDGETYLPS